MKETFLTKQDLHKPNSINDFFGAGESTTDLSMGLMRGRIPVGMVILWHKKYDALINVISWMWIGVQQSKLCMIKMYLLL